MTQQDEKTLEQELENAQNIQDQKAQEIGENWQEAEIIKLKQENQALSETCKRAQIDYISLRADMDIYQRRMQEKEQSMKVDILTDTLKKILPFLEEFRKSLENISEDQKNTPFSNWLQMLYEKRLKKLEEMGVKTIESLWLTPDSELHEPISAMPTQDPALKGKIIQEFEKGFIYQKDGQKKIISPAKVVIWQ